MRKKYKVDRITAVRITFIATDGETEVEAEAAFDEPKDALRIMQEEELEVEIDAEAKGETTTKFNLKSKQDGQSQEPSEHQESGEHSVDGSSDKPAEVGGVQSA